MGTLPAPADGTTQLSMKDIEAIGPKITVREKCLADLESSPEYPNGTVQYKLSVPNGSTSSQVCSVGWALLVTGSNKSELKSTHYKQCLGNYQCPHPDCNFAERPQVPRGSTTKHSPPIPCTTVCLKHGVQLIHIACAAKLKIVSDVRSVHMIHSGVHNHRKPHPIRANLTAATIFKEVVLIASEVKAKALQIGTNGRAPIGDLHPAYHNLSRVAMHRRNVLCTVTPPSSIGFLAAFEKRMGCQIIYSSGFNDADGHIICITEFMKNVLLKELSTGLQTDTIEGFVIDLHSPNVNVTMTTAFNHVLNRNAPVVISVLMGKSGPHYKRHFLALFEALGLPTDLSGFKAEFPGNTCDFSDAFKAGFQAAVREHCQNTEVDIVWENFYRCCTVHFKRTMNRVAANGLLVPPIKKAEFIRDVLTLLSPDLQITDLDSMLRSLETRFPKLLRWLQWHRSRARYIFPAAIDATAKASNAMMSIDTNAQECIGGDFQATAPTATVYIGQCLEHILRYLKNNQFDHALASSGFHLRYSRTTVTPKKSYRNDGRPPDTSKKLLMPSGKTGPPFGTNNHQPLPSMLPKFGIPWGFEYKDFKAENTCAMDTVLMSLYLLHELGGLCWEAGEIPVLGVVLQLIKKEEYAEARYRWCIDVLNHPLDASISAFHSVNYHIEAGLLQLFEFEMTNDYYPCDSDHCPNPNGHRESGMKIDHEISAPVPCVELTQRVLDLFVQNESTVRCCELGSAEYVEGKPPIAFRQQIVVTEDGSSELLLKCNGTYHGFPRVFNQHPKILNYSIVVGNDVSTIMYTKPERTIILGDLQYTLAVVIYWVNQKTHFSCHVLIGDTVVYYDGLDKRQKMKWQSFEAYYQHKQPIAHIWYVQKRLAGTTEVPESQPASGPSSDSDIETHLEKDRKQCLKASPKRPAVRKEPFAQLKSQKSKNDNKRPKLSYPTGISMQIVSAKGPLPKCASCDSLLDRLQSRVVHKYVKDAMRGHMQQDTYHDDEKCLTWMSEKEKQELRPQGFESHSVSHNDNGDSKDSEETANSNEYSDEGSANGSADQYQYIDKIAVVHESSDNVSESGESIEYGSAGYGRKDRMQVPDPMQVPEEEFNFEELSSGQFLVQSLLDRRPAKGKKQEYLVKWVDYDKPEDNTWELGSGLPKQLVTEYNKKFPLRRR